MHTTLSEVHSRPGGQPSLDDVCDSLVETLIPERPDDDAALLVARTCALPPDRSPCQGRRQVGAWGLERLALATELLVSELVTNAIRHAQPPIQLRMIRDTALSCEVSDRSLP